MLAAKRVDIVVVCKVDRLTRSLADFAKMVEIMDKAQVSFVSVTQAFNTTTSMGRLTLNVLLSFAQFEREVTGERIRDKFAASKAKGMFMGGPPPLGYDLGERALIVNPDEAETVRFIFRRYLELETIFHLAKDLERSGVKSKLHTSRDGNTRGGVPINPGALTHMLDNPVYCGIISHKGALHPGQHERIIDQELWDAVQALRGKTRGKGRTQSIRSGARLIGKAFDARDNPMSPTATKKGSVRYRYYITRRLRGAKEAISRTPMTELEDAVIAELAPLLAPTWLPERAADDRALQAVRRVRLFANELVIEASPAAFGGSPEDEMRVMKCAISFARPRNATTIIRSGSVGGAKIDRSLVRALVMARQWMKQLDAGEVDSIKGLARAEGLCVLHTAKLLPLAYLAPDLVERILEGRSRGR